MTTGEIAVAIVAALGGQAVLLGVVAYLAKSIVTHQLTKDIEKYRSELEAANARSIEQLRHELHVEAVKDEVRFRSIHAKVAEVVAETYRLLVPFVRSFVDFLKSFKQDNVGERKETLEALTANYEASWDYWASHRIYFPSVAALKLTRFHESIVEVVSTFRQHVPMDMPADRVNALGQEPWALQTVELSDEAGLIMEELQSTFQKLIGLDELLGRPAGSDEIAPSA